MTIMNYIVQVKKSEGEDFQFQKVFDTMPFMETEGRWKLRCRQVSKTDISQIHEDSYALTNLAETA